MLKVKAYRNDGTEVEANAGPRARVEVERRFGRPFWHMFGKDALHGSEDAVYFLAYSALRLADIDVGDDYDKWLTTITDADVWQESEPENPTQRAAKPAKS